MASIQALTRVCSRNSNWTAKIENGHWVALKEIDFDRETGKLPDSDYELLKAKYTGVALEALRAESLGKPAASLDTMIANRVRTIRCAGSLQTRCAACGPRPEPDAVYCSSCGHRLDPVAGADSTLPNSPSTPASAGPRQKPFPAPREVPG